MPTYPVIPITQYYDNATEYDPRAAKVELGKGGVLDRSRIHFFNNTRKSYSISAVLQEKSTLQNFLELNRGKPFEFRYDGANSAGLYICKTWSWDWVVYVDGVGGVWNFSATFEQVFRPGWVSQTLGAGTLILPALSVSGSGVISINPSGSGSLIVPIFTVNGAGEVIQSTQGSGSLTWPVIQVSGSGSLINNGSGTIVWPTLTMSGAGTVSIMPDGEGNLEVPIFSVDGSGNINVTYSGNGSIETSPITVDGEGIIYATHTGTGTLVVPDMSVNGSGSLSMAGSGDLETSGIVVSGAGTAESLATPWTPTELSPRFYIESFDSSTLFDAVSGGSLPANGAAIARWEDKSANGFHLTTTPTSSRPLRTINSQGGQDGVTFDGINDWMENASATFGLVDRTLFIVFKENAVVVNGGLVVIKPSVGQNDFGVSSGTGNGYVVATSNRTSARFGVSGSNFSSGSTYYELLDTTTPATILPTTMYCEVKSGLTSTLFRNGSSIATDAAFTEFTAMSAGGINLGARYLPGLSGPYLNGVVYGVVYVEGALSTDNRQRLEGYFAHRLGATANLAADHPYKTVAP